MSVAPFKLNTNPIDEETRQVAEKELNETPERVASAVAELRSLLQAATDLHYFDDDEFLITFLRPCHFYPESALNLMRKIAEFKLENKAILNNLMPEDEKSSFIENDVVNVLTNCDQDGRRVLIVHCGSQWDTKKVNSDQLFRLFYLIHVAAQVEPQSQVRGVVVIMDFNGMGLKHVGALSPAFSKRLLTFIQDAMPLRLKQVHMVNQPYLFNMVWTLFKPFVREKLKGRMFFHGKDRKSLHKHIKPTHLPSDYGGDLPAINYGGKDWYPCVNDHEKYIQRWNDCGFANQ